MFIYEHTDWPEFVWDAERLLPFLSSVRNRQGRLVGKMEAFSFEQQRAANFAVLTLDVLKSSEIEGEKFDVEQVRSSLARRLSLDVYGLPDAERHVDGMVEMMLDATENYNGRLDKARLLSWHNALFPVGYSGTRRTAVGRWRDDATGPMQVVSGPMGRETVHYTAPKAERIESEMHVFFDWCNRQPTVDLVLKAAVAHLWFVTVHPFDDGNGRIARAIADMMLARSDEQTFRFYSMSAQIRKERKQYYRILEITQKGDLNITGWLEWFLQALERSIDASEALLSTVMFRHEFWLNHEHEVRNDRQRKILNMLIDGFDGKLTTSKWAKICKCSQDTALRDIQDLIDKRILIKQTAGGRSTNYVLL